MRKQVMFLEEWYDMETLLDGSIILSKEKNKNGFTMIIKFSGDSKEHEQANQAVYNFFKYYILV